MKIRTKLILLLFFIVASFVTGAVIYQSVEARNITDLVSKEKKYKKEIFDSLLSLQGQPMENFVRDYTYWDDMVDFISNGHDKIWAVQNIDSSITAFKIDAVWVYKSDFTLHYSASILEKGRLQESPLPKENPERMFQNSRFPHFFVSTPSGMMEIRGASVHPSADAERKTPPRGYFFAGKLWDKKFLDETAVLLGRNTELIIESAFSRHSCDTELDKKQSIITFSKPVKAWNNGVLGYIHVHITSDFASQFKLKNDELMQLLLFALFSILIAVILIKKWIDVPLKLISASMVTENPDLIEKLQKEKNEFGDVARLAAYFFSQREAIFREVSERRRAEESLKGSNQFNEEIILNSLEGIVVYDENLKYLLWNPFMEKLTGIPEEQAVGRFCLDLFPHLKERGVDLLLQRALKGEIVQSPDTPYYVPQTGRSGWTTGIYGPHKNAAGKIIGAIGMVRDITEQKKINDELRENEEKFSKAFATSAVLMAISTLEDGRFIDVNDEFVRTLGYKKNEIIGKTSHDLGIYQEDLHRESTVQELLEKDTVRNVETEIRTRSGELRSGSFSADIITLKGLRCLLTCVVDITEQKQARDALKESEEKFRAITSVAKDAIILADSDDRIVFWNESARTMFGYYSDEACGRNLHELIAVKMYPEAKKSSFAGFQNTGRSPILGKILELTAKKKDGTEFPVELSISAVKIKNIWHAIGIMRDISERKSIEQMAFNQKRIESMGLLAGGIAHDFNNLLTSIYGNIKLVKMYGSLNEENLQFIKGAEKSIHDAKSLSEQLMTFSRGGEPVKEVIDASKLLKDIVPFHLRGTNVKAEFVVDAGLWNVEVDEGQIKQVISNIVINAVQSMPKGGVLRVAVSRVAADENISAGDLSKGEYIRISFKDEGTGMTADVLSRLFTPFFSTKSIGRGLGLSICYSIIKKHQGSITAQSEPGKGSDFQIYLPATEKLPENSKSPQKMPDMKLPLRILVMDDEESILQLLRDFLTKAGAQVETSRHGREAVEKYKAAKDSGNPFDVVILDLTITGGMGGLDTMKELKAYHDGIKAVMMSGYSRDIIMSDIAKYGFKGSIRKPFDLLYVLETVKSVAEKG